MANKKDPRIEGKRRIVRTTLGEFYFERIDILKEKKEVRSTNDAILQALDFWFDNCKTFTEVYEDD